MLMMGWISLLCACLQGVLKFPFLRWGGSTTADTHLLAFSFFFFFFCCSNRVSFVATLTLVTRLLALPGVLWLRIAFYSALEAPLLQIYYHLSLPNISKHPNLLYSLDRASPSSRKPSKLPQRTLFVLLMTLLGLSLKALTLKILYARQLRYMIHLTQLSSISVPETLLVHDARGILGICFFLTKGSPPFHRTCSRSPRTHGRTGNNLSNVLGF
ncbi:hypothetical protein BJ912DRAFT_610664 [Pholiota molesta]|nr:hypothetical protein BJ912DRAFT_610664 [Pholiota molesta]